MRGRIRSLSAAAAVLLAAAFLAPGVSAQAAGPASSVKSTPAEWVGAADALVQSAARAPASEADYAALIAAANAYRIGGRLSSARRVALKAATQAQRAGFDVTAARAYLAAATLSDDLNEPDVARGYYAQCRQLADLKPAVRRS
jgi:hypothetical protein